MESSPSDGSVGEAGQACRLPREIVRHILLDSLDPFTILSMRRTCKLIYKTSRDKDIWVATLEKVCEEYGIFKPTFPMAQMSLMELEHAATSPQRFLSLIAHPHPNTQPIQYRLHPRRKHREPLSIDSDPNGRPYLVENLMLVPGGRYLLCTVQMGDSEGHDIAIWDLGYNSKQYLDPYPVKLIEDRELDSVTPPQDGSKLVLATRPSMSAGLLDIYEVDFTSQPPDHSSRSLGHLLMDVDDLYWHVVRLTDNDILIWREPFFIFWDWKSGVGGRWEVSKGLNDNCKPYASKTSIVACATDNSILVWDFPSGGIAALPDQPSVDQLPMSVIWPKFILPLEHNWQVVWMAATPEWQHKSSAELDHHICISVQRHGTQMRLYSVKPRGGTGVDPFLPTSFLVEGGRTQELEGGDMSQPRGSSPLYRVGDKLILCAGINGGGLEARTFEIPTGFTTETVDAPSLVLTDPRHPTFAHIRGNRIGFCPTSGRLMYVSNCWDLVVLDFLCPPLRDPERQGI